ncbi:MAG: hypothetical protein ACQESR_01940 [Planctomycetota bacterium]
MESSPTQAVFPLVGLAAEKVIRGRYILPACRVGSTLITEELGDEVTTWEFFKNRTADVDDARSECPRPTDQVASGPVRGVL